MSSAPARLLATLVLAACSHDAPSPPPPGKLDAAQAAAIVAAPDRSDRDKKRDEHRKPAELLVFVGIAPGMHVADLGAGGGYTSELLARAVGPTGSVIAQDTPHWGTPDDPGLVNSGRRLGWPSRSSRTSPMSRATGMTRCRPRPRTSTW